MEKKRRYISRKTGGGRVTREAGYTLIELMVTVTILGVLLTLAVLSWTSITRENALTSGAKQVEAAMKRAKTLAEQENVTYILRFIAHSDVSHPDTYAFFRPGVPEPAANKSVTGESNNEGYISLANGVTMSGSANVSITFAPAGTTIAVTPAPTTVQLSMGGSSRTVSITSSGKINL